MSLNEETKQNLCKKFVKCGIIIMIITCKIVYFAIPADHRKKLKECEKRDKYLDLARELKKLWNNYTNCNWYVWNSN